MKKQAQATTPAAVSPRLNNNAFKQAYASVPSAQKTRAFTMLVCAGITFALLLLSRLLWLFEPLLDKIYYGTLSEILYYALLFVLCVVYSFVLNNYVKKNCDERIFEVRKQKMSIPQMLAIIAIAALTVFIANAAFRFRTKIQIEMGSGITMAAALVNVSVYFYYAIHMWFGFTAAALIQKALSILFPAKHTVPWGAIFIVTVYALTELILELTTTAHMFPWMYFLFTYTYAIIYEIAERRFHVTYWAAFIVMVL